MNTVSKILYFLTAREKTQAIFLLMMVLMMAILDLVGIASILPFITLLANPKNLETNDTLNYFSKKFNDYGISSYQEIIFFSAIIVFVLLLFSLFFKTVTVYFQLRFTQMRGFSISKRLFNSYLNQPFEWHLSRNSGELSKSILSEVSLIVDQGLKPILHLVSDVILSFAIIVFLLFIDFKITILAFTIISAYYLIVYGLTKKILKNIGSERVKVNELRFVILNEAFGAVKQVKVSGLEEFFIKRFETPAKQFAYYLATSSIISHLPRFLLEALVFGSILFFIIYKTDLTGSFNETIPLVSLFTFACYRLMPSIQRIYGAISMLKYSSAAINVLYNDMKSFNNLTICKKGIKSIKLNNEIILENISYHYPNSSKTSLENISIKIPARTMVGLVGTTGSGKTTIVDIILGLLEYQKGILKVDGKVITKHNIKEWQHSVGYVPQNVYLSDDSIEANIAFGTEVGNICSQSVKEAAKIANIDEFIVEDLPYQYQTIIGEGGARLSGGQRQRIGIARALYHKPSLLILDEVTSALDNKTEKVVMDGISSLKQNITIIVIAHRLSSLSNCDIIYELDNGVIKKK